LYFGKEVMECLYGIYQEETTRGFGTTNAQFVGPMSQQSGDPASTGDFAVSAATTVRDIQTRFFGEGESALIKLRHKAKRSGYPLQVMFQDEARFGLIRSLRPCWACRAIRPELPNRIARQYTYVYGAVSPLDGKSDFLILPSMRKQAFDCFLGELSNRYPNEHIALIVDGAASHRSESVDVPENITLIGLPPYSPQLNPIENLWKVMRERFFPNLDFDCMERFEQNICDALNHLEQDLQRIKSITGYKC
jgi:transposase